MFSLLAMLGISQTAARWIGIGVVAASVAGAVLWIDNLRETAAAYDVLRANVETLEAKFGCADRAPAERELAACLAARDLVATQVQRDEMARQRDDAARAQADLDRQNAGAQAVERATDAYIDQAPPTADGPVPKVLLDTWERWEREQSERAVK